MKKTLTYFFKCPRLSAGCLTAFLFFVFSVNVFAQSDTTAKLDEVKILSTAAPQLPAITPSQAISADDFIHYNAFNVADAIRDFSGVTIKDYGGIGGLKTISVRGLGANHTAVLYDGVQINDAENGQVDLGKLNLTNVQQITLYIAQPPNILQTARAFASASVLAIETVKPHLSAAKPYQITAGIKTGSFGLVNPYLQWQQRLSDNWLFVVNSYIENANGRYKYLAIDSTITNKQQTRIGSGVAIQQIDGALYWNNTGNKFNLDINYYNADRGVPGVVIANKPPPTGQKLYNRDLFLQAGYERDWKSGLQLLINSKLSQNQLHYFDPQFHTSAGFLDQHYSQREYYQSAALAFHIKPNWEISYATDLALNNMTSDLGVFKYPTRITLLNVLASNLILGNLTLEVNLLNTNINETVKFGKAAHGRNKFSPTLMATIKPLADQNFSLRAFYKSIFRAPTFNEQYYGFTSNPNLSPETADQYDLGINYNKNLSGLFNFISFTTDGYYNKVTNKIVFAPSLTIGPSQNYGKVDIKGLDASLKTQVKLADYKVSLSANYSYQQVLDVTDPAINTYLKQLPYIPQNTVALNAGVSRGPLGLYYNQVLLSSRHFTYNNNLDDALPAYTVSDASVVYKNYLLHLPVTLSAEVNNIFNKSYTVVRNYPMPGLSFRFSFQITI